MSFPNRRFLLGLLALAPLSTAIAQAAPPVCDGFVCTTVSGTGVQVGPTASAGGQQSIAVGDTASAAGFASTATGSAASASGDNSAAFGSTARATGGQATALGNHATASGGNAIALGNFSNASVVSAMALGDNTAASGAFGTAVGAQASASGDSSSAFGAAASASGQNALALGGQATAQGSNSVAIGPFASASGVNCVALGADSNCTRDNTVDIGNRAISNVAAGTLDFDAVNVVQLRSVAGGLGGGAGLNPDGTFKAPTYNLSTGSYSDVGSALTALDDKPSGGGAGAPFIASAETDAAIAKIDTRDGFSGNTSVGAGAASGSGLNQHNTAIGAFSSAGTTGDVADATGGQATAVGASAQANNLSSTALGYNAVSTGRFSTAIGAFAVADENFTVSFGHRGDPGFLDNTSRLLFVSPGIAGTDAMNVNQGNTIASWYGGGSEFLNGLAIAPRFQLSGGMFRDVNSALQYLDNKAGTGDGTGGVGPQGPQGPQGNPGPANGHDDAAIHYDTRPDGSVDTANATLQGQGGTTIHNLHAGVAVDDAANVGQVQQSLVDAKSYSDAGDQRTLNSANAHADAGDAQTRDWAKAYTDSQIRPLNRRIAQAGAVGTVMGSMALSAGSIPQQSKLSMGVAGYRGQSAIGLAYTYRFENERVAVSIGGAFAGEGSAIAASVSIGLGK
jgi:autotransporter adhesin